MADQPEDYWFWDLDKRKEDWQKSKDYLEEAKAEGRQDLTSGNLNPEDTAAVLLVLKDAPIEWPPNQTIVNEITSYLESRFGIERSVARDTAISAYGEYSTTIRARLAGN